MRHDGLLRSRRRGNLPAYARAHGAHAGAHARAHARAPERQAYGQAHDDDDEDARDDDDEDARDDDDEDARDDDDEDARGPAGPRRVFGFRQGDLQAFPSETQLQEGRLPLEEEEGEVPAQAHQGLGPSASRAREVFTSDAAADVDAP